MLIKFDKYHDISGRGWMFLVQCITRIPTNYHFLITVHSEDIFIIVKGSLNTRSMEKHKVKQCGWIIELLGIRGVYVPRIR